MAEYTANSELSGSESKHDGQAMPEGHRWTEVRPDAEGAAACWACGSRALRFGRPHVKLSGVGVPHNYVRLWVAVCVTFFTVQSLLKATIYL